MSPASPQEPRLTLAMIVANDPSGLQRTLASVAAYVDAIVICDTGEDEQVAACGRSFGVQVLAHPWCDSFALARNECLRQITRGSWVLWLDAGETMTQADIQGLRAYVDQHEPKMAGMLLVKTPPVPDSLDGEQIARIRLIPRWPGLRFEGRVRETIRPSLEMLNFPIEGLPFRIQRGEEDQQSERREMRARRNIELADLEMREAGRQPHLLNCLAEAFQILKQPSDAISYYRQACECGVAGSADRLEALYGLLSIEDGQTDNDARMELCLKALEEFPLDMQLLCAMGGYLQAGGRWDLALRSYETAYRFGQIQPEVWHMDQLRAIAAECFALSLQLHGQPDAATQILEQALAGEAGSHRLQRQLLDAYVKQARRDDAWALMDRCWKGRPDLESLRSAVRGACLAAQQNWISARAYLQVAYQAGCRDTLCLRWLSTTLLASGDGQAAHEILTQWAQLEPQNIEPRRILDALQRDTPAEASPSASGPPRQLRVDAESAESHPGHTAARERVSKTKD
jgi:hypothetical protein